MRTRSDAGRWPGAAKLPGAWLALFSLTALSPLAAEPARLEMQPAEVVGTMRDDVGKPAVDISGIACAPAAADGMRRCLLVNDEDRSAQTANLDQAGRVIVGPKIPLLGRSAPAGTPGEPQPVTCRSGAAPFRDLDGEGVAFAAPYFYVVGSHACSRNGKSRDSIFLLARLRTDAKGRAVDARGRAATGDRKARDTVQLTYRLGAVLAAAPRVGEWFGRDLDLGGLNVEGVAVIGDMLYAGLRAPALGGETFIVGAKVEALFDARRSPDEPPVLLTMRLGENTGVRDLAALPDGRLLVLYGSDKDQPGVPYGLATLDPRGGAVLKLGELPELAEGGRSGKAEAVLPLGAEGNRLNVLVFYDSLPDGRPQKVSVPLP
jgi:hypothetical protein